MILVQREQLGGGRLQNEWTEKVENSRDYKIFDIAEKLSYQSIIRTKSVLFLLRLHAEKATRKTNILYCTLVCITLT